jgi:hypothetical protein
VGGRGLGPQFEGDLFVGAATPLTVDTFQFDLTGNRRRIAVNDHLLEDRVADNTTEHDPTESESLLIGRDFAVGTDIEWHERKPVRGVVDEGSDLRGRLPALVQDQAGCWSAPLGLPA